MARRRHGHDSELPFVALMDTMTNVVGVLTIILVMIGISLANAVRKVFSDLPPATIEQVREAEAAVSKLDAIEKALADKLKALQKPDLSPSKLNTLKSELMKLEQAAKEKGIKLFNLDALNKELAKKSEELKAKKEEADKLLQELNRLKALLDNTPILKPPDPKTVRIPEGRPIPPKAKIERFIVTKDGVYYVDLEGIKAAFIREFQSMVADRMIRQRTKQGNKSVIIYDQEKMVAFFTTRNLQFRNFLIQVPYSKPYTSPAVKAIPKPGSGETPQQIIAMNSAFQSAMRRIRQTPQTVVLFTVTPDAFENYLVAREICDHFGVPAGWDMSSEPSYLFRVSEIKMNALEAPPTPNPNAPKPTPGPNLIKLD